MTRATFAGTGWHVLALAVYYAGIVAGLIYLYGRGDVTPPPFVYQGF